MGSMKHFDVNVKPGPEAMTVWKFILLLSRLDILQTSGVDTSNFNSMHTIKVHV